MPSSTSSSELRFFGALALTFCALFGAWESVLRSRASGPVDVGIDRPAMRGRGNGPGREEWVLFGNCLVMTGLSPRKLDEQLGPNSERVILNIAAHEQSPIAFIDYLRSTKHYPDVVVTNVSSWLNGTNFEQEAALVTSADPLSLRGDGRPAESGASGSSEGGGRRWQQSAEDDLARWSGQQLLSVGHRYHLFDFSMFLGALARTRSVDDALYELNMQSWFRVAESETDGLGYLGLKVRYRDDWGAGLERMADRTLKRLRLSRVLTDRYWALLEEGIVDLLRHGTRVVLVRMPEHPRIRAFNDEVYGLGSQLALSAEKTGAEVIDLSHLGPGEGIRLFDAVHPDAESAAVISRKVGEWLQLHPREQRRSDRAREAREAGQR